MDPRARRLLVGRQVRRVGRPRAVRHVVKVTDEQEEQLLLLAAARRVSVSRLMVESALSGDATRAQVKAELSGELFRVMRLLGKVGVNINQIAKATNTTFELQPDTAGAIAAHGRVCERLERLLDQLEGTVRGDS